MNKQRKTSHILNVFQYDVDGHVVLPASLTLTVAPAGNDNSGKVGTTAWVRSYVSGLNYLTGNQSITFSGDATGTGTTSIALTLANTAVTPGTYGSTTLVPVVTVDAKGRITNVTTAAISGSLTFTGDVTGTGTTGTSTGLTLANSGVTVGTYTKVTVDSKGRVTVGASATTSDISEGTNLYYTDARVLSYLSANTYATQSYVNTQVSNLVAAAPATLDTLNELAAALGNDPSFATTISTALGNRLRVDINNQGLSATLQGYGRTNLGLGTAATSNTGDFVAYRTFGTAANSATGDFVAYRTFGTAANNNTGDFALASHTHSIADVTGLQTALDGKQASGSYAASSHSHIISDVTGLQTALDGKQASLGFTPYNSTNPSGYITSYTETDTLASVVGRGATTTSSITTAGLIISTADVDVRVNRGRFQVWNNAATGNLGYRIRTDENGGWRWQFVDGGNVEYFGVAYSTGVLTLRPSSGTIIERGGFTDFIGYNASYGSYIGGGVNNASSYLYAGGYFYDGATTRTLIHSGNIGSQSVSYATTAGSLTSMNISQFTNNSGYVTTSGLSTDTDSEQTVGGRVYYFNSGAGRMNIDPRWNESGYDAGLGCLHLWSWTAAGVAYGRAGIAFYNDNAYQYLTTKSNTTGLFINNTQVVTNSGTWGISISGSAAQLGGYSPSGTVGANTVVIRDANNYIYAYYINSSVSETENPTINSFYTSNGDGWLRKSSLAHVRSQLGNYGGWITGYTETDTLNSVTGRGNTTSNAITVGLLIAQGPGGNYNENIRLPGGTAVISFNTSGATGAGSYNIVSQTDFQIRNAGGTQVFVMDQSGNLTMTGSMRAPIFYDTNDTAYYLNPAGGSRLRNLYVGDSGDDWSDPGGWGTQVRFSNGPHVRFVLHARTPGIEAGMYVHTPGSVYIGSYTSHDVSLMYGGSRKMGFNASYIYTDVYLEAAGSVRAPIFYDSNDTGYYADFNSTSNSAMRVRGGTLYGPNTTWGAYLQVGGNGNENTAYTSVVSTNGNLHMDPANNCHMYLNYYVNGYIYLNGTSYYISTNGSYYNGTAAAANSVAWGNVSSKPSHIMYYQSFTLDANTMDVNATGFTYAVNAPHTGPIVRFSAGGSYDMWLNAPYSGGGNSISFRTRNGDTATLNPWREIIHTGNIGSQKVDGSLKFWATSHPNDYYLVNNWTGTYWRITSNHPSGVQVAYADTAGSAPASGGNSSTVGGYSVDVNGTANTIPTRNASGYLIPQNWIQFNGNYGLYFPNHYGLHFYPNNDGSYGAAQILGEKNGWRGLHFGGGTGITLMMNEGEFGFHRQAVGWVARFTSGRFYGTSDDTVSIASAVGGGYTWTGINYFQTNNGGQAVNNSNSAKLQAYSSGGNSAFMSFHRGGYYAVNFGLDDDNVMRIGGWSAGANRWQLDMSGNMTVAGDVTAYSDARVKENISTIENALSKVLTLRGVSYNRIDSDDKKTKIGVIAQEILQIVPEVVNQDNDGMFNVSYGNLAGLFIEAFKEQQKEIEELKTQINYLVENK